MIFLYRHIKNLHRPSFRIYSTRFNFSYIIIDILKLFYKAVSYFVKSGARYIKAQYKTHKAKQEKE